MSIVRSDRALDVVVDDGVIPGAAGDGAATDHRSSISVATPSNLRCSHVVLLKTGSPASIRDDAKTQDMQEGQFLRSFGTLWEVTDL